jgi:hypothetical protein
MTTLLDELYAFYLEPEYCGELDGGVEGDRVCMACTCWTRLIRTIEAGLDPNCEMH